ncbi:bile acid:sodium symporter family protein [Sunxiuqinia indica]|uniref:bile acid:sodium symporter family protein n=1 Tax=Sunxiuqinia indica TaxID=2692584 RepID=UPI0013593940|nr:bile acid:sodium symporter family protein [Sunxiuqinia indica]
MQKLQRYTLWLGVLAALLLVVSLSAGYGNLISPLTVIAAVSITIGLGSIPLLKSYQYTAWIMLAFVCGMIYPSAFLQWGSFDLRNKWLILIVVQLVMFGMGTQMSLKDFAGLRTMGRGVLVGIICQFSIMPLTGYILTRIFDFDPEIAAGIILIGSCSSGLASNVMVYIAKANLALSVTLTTLATLVAPIMTPFLMKMLASTYVQINFLEMCMQIIKIVIVPVGAALLFDAYKNYSSSIRRKINWAFYISIGWLLACYIFLWDFLASLLSNDSLLVLELMNFLLGAVVVGKLYFHLTEILPRVQGFMPKISMFGIVYFTTVTTAASRENILTVGIFILMASIIHNSLGYTFGYSISRLLGLDKDSCRTVALEVGLQNGGMASGLAGVMGKLATIGLASAVFSPWMNISGSILANYWKRKKISETIQ